MKTLVENSKKISELNILYDKLQKKYGDKNLDSIYNGGCVLNPNICFIFMNPTGRNIASEKNWKGIKAPWLGTKNIWKLFYHIGLLEKETYEKVLSMKSSDWDYEFSNNLYKEIEEKKYFITNLGKCTQIDARPLTDDILKKYLDLLYKEIDIIKPKIIITFGNQVSSIVINEKIAVSKCRQKYYEKEINGNKYKIFPVYYPVGNAIYNMPKAIIDIKEIIKNYID